MSQVRVAVIGGGLAGITAAIALAEAGAAVTLLEARPRLGGATCSFTRDGLIVDTGQHVFLGCCTAYRGLLAQLGMTAHAPLQDRFDVTVLAPGPQGPRRQRLRRTALPGPLHMLPALARYRFLSLAERASVSRPALAMRRTDPAAPVVDEQRFGDWLAARGQTERARRALWDLFTVSALNIAGDDASLALAATVVKTGLLGRNNAADIGVPALPLGELHGDAAATHLAKLGAQVFTGAKVSAIEVAAAHPGPADPSSPRFLVRLARPLDPAAPAPGAHGPAGGSLADASLADGSLADGSLAAATQIAADAIVLAVPHEAAARLVPPGALPDAAVAGWAGLGASPIVNVHVIYDRPVTDLPFAAAIDSPVQWVFDRTRISGLARNSPGKPQYLAISLSAADDYVDVPAAELRDRFVPALAELFPAARDARITEFFVTRERRATFRQAPGTGRLRPQAATGLPGLVLAGAWTATGWPDTMEGAVRSGQAAADELRRTVLSAPGLSAPGLSAPGLSRAGYSGSVVSGSGAIGSASTIGVRQ
jgi:uncharacterized protein with NAD-binding domain and iron-sulfur cluster